MKRSHKIAVGILASLGLGFTVAAAYAHPGGMSGGMGPEAMGGVQHGMSGGMGHGAMSGGAAGPMAGLITPDERAALQEKMRNAKTPEERQKLAETTRAEMQKRAKEKDVALPEHRGPHAGFGPNAAPAPQAPGATTQPR
jgi:hypothetical protein